MKEYSFDPAKVAVTMKYVLNSDLPPITIKSDDNVLSYMVLKDMNHDPAKCSIHIEITTAHIEKQPIALSVDVQSNEHEFLLTDMSSDICGVAMETVLIHQQLPLDRVSSTILLAVGVSFVSLVGVNMRRAASLSQSSSFAFLGIYNDSTAFGILLGYISK
ncbi:Hypothetical predicted protein [Olea europaea subsp. europaea]|uniref:Uncharacterized protein n=1 Tax=Olea europaea subsp. europaea TaxID=158383 RepID=A0A8S0SL19_OLEEU|nr:Hypothetical predicted protein [Olea europaea subsp. europaea]